MIQETEKDVAQQATVNTTEFGITEYCVPAEVASALMKKGWFCCHINEDIAHWHMRAEETKIFYEDSKLSDFERRLRFHMRECAEGRHDPNDLKDVIDTANELISLVGCGNSTT